MAKRKLYNRVARGRKGGKASLRTMTPEGRRHRAKRAALARWQKTPKEQRRDLARKAVQARWAQVRARKKTQGR